MKRVIVAARKRDDLKERVYEVVAKEYDRHGEEIENDYMDYKRKYDIYDSSLLSFLVDNSSQYFMQAVVNAVSPEEGKRAIFLLAAMTEDDFENLLF